MSKRFAFFAAVLCAAMILPAAASAQQAEPPVYTFVAEWAVERNKWDEFSAGFEKVSKPILERLSANGTLVSWGSYSSVVHLDGEYTHGTWFAANSIAGIERARGELIKAPNPAMAGATKHRDYLLRSITRGSRTAGPASGYLWVSSAVVNPGRGQDWRAHWDKYSKPVYEQLLKDGVITWYSIDVEQAHTEASGLRFVVYVTPNADGVDKVSAAFTAANQKRSEEERRAIGQALGDMTVAGAHRDYFAWVALYWNK
jgi:hypothetical protein